VWVRLEHRFCKAVLLIGIVLIGFSVWFGLVEIELFD